MKGFDHPTVLIHNKYWDVEVFIRALAAKADSEANSRGN
jgi:hypothetical protein